MVPCGGEAKRKRKAVAVGWPLLGAAGRPHGAGAPPEPEAQARKPEELRVEEDVPLATLLPGSGLADAVGESDPKREGSFSCHFPDPGAPKWPWVKAVLVANLTRAVKGGIPGKRGERSGEAAVVAETEMGQEPPCCQTPNTKGKLK